jgi:hypothetical protein
VNIVSVRRPRQNRIRVQLPSLHEVSSKLNRDALISIARIAFKSEGGMGITKRISATEAIRFLRTASDPRTPFYIVGQRPDLNYRGVVRFVKDGWVLHAFWSNGFFNYVDSLTSPAGFVGSRTQWHGDAGVPNHLEDLLTEEEFGWLCWSLMAADAVEIPGAPERFIASTVHDHRRDATLETRQRI